MPFAIRTSALILAPCLLLVGCGATPAGPSPDRYRRPRLILYCQPSSEQVTCSAMLFDVPSFRDSAVVTATAEWTVVPSDVGAFIEPGVLSPGRVGEAEIHARSLGIDVDHAPRFLIGPGQPARWMQFFAPTIRERESNSPIDGAVVQMLDGYRSGATCTTTSGGICTIDRVLTGETFSARISKAGFQTVTVSYRVDPPVGAAGNPPFLTVVLPRS